MYRSAGVRGEVFGPWAIGVSGVATDNPVLTRQPHRRGSKVLSTVPGANGVVAKNLGANPTATGSALMAEVLSINATPGLFINVNGQSNGNNTGPLIVGDICTPPATGTWPSWYSCPSTNRRTVFKVDTFGNTSLNSVQTWIPNAGTGERHAGSIIWRSSDPFGSFTEFDDGDHGKHNNHERNYWNSHGQRGNHRQCHHCYGGLHDMPVR